MARPLKQSHAPRGQEQYDAASLGEAQIQNPDTHLKSPGTIVTRNSRFLSRHLARSVRISLTTRPCTLRVKVYGTYLVESLSKTIANGL